MIAYGIQLPEKKTLKTAKNSIIKKYETQTKKISLEFFFHPPHENEESHRRSHGTERKLQFYTISESFV